MEILPAVWLVSATTLIIVVTVTKLLSNFTKKRGKQKP
jgi:hypothetical protein